MAQATSRTLARHTLTAGSLKKHPGRAAGVAFGATVRDRVASCRSQGARKKVGGFGATSATDSELCVSAKADAVCRRLLLLLRQLIASDRSDD